MRHKAQQNDDDSDSNNNNNCHERTTENDDDVTEEKLTDWKLEKQMEQSAREPHTHVIIIVIIVMHCRIYGQFRHQNIFVWKFSLHFHFLFSHCTSHSTRIINNNNITETQWLFQILKFLQFLFLFWFDLVVVVEFDFRGTEKEKFMELNRKR